jgi:hypothetical protein
MGMKVRTRAVVASDPAVAEVATEQLAAGASAVSAVAAAFFAAAGAHPGTLLGPVSVLVAGIGEGSRAFDGRVGQPGLGAPRPRGFQPGQPVPLSARVGVPLGVLAVLVACARHGGAARASILRGGVVAAKRAGASARAALLERIAEAGPVALQEAAFARPFVRIAGRSEGGLLTEQDLGAIPSVDCAARERPSVAGALVEVPWAGEGANEGRHDSLGDGAVVMAVDSRAVFAVLTYRRVTEGAAIDDLQLIAPCLAEPVMRGVPRVRPGVRLPAPAPIALRRDSQQRVIEALASPESPMLDEDRPALWLARHPETGGVETRPA